MNYRVSKPILNDDTDSLKIGDRIYVNGQWAGTILYIGETTLGLGDWVGVILDDPSLGRTNGIVTWTMLFSNIQQSRHILSFN